MHIHEKVKVNAFVARSTCPNQQHQVRNTSGSWHVEQVHGVVARSTFPSQTCSKHTSFGPLLDVVSHGGRRGWRTLSKVSRTWRFCSSFKSDGRHGTFEEGLPGISWFWNDRCSTSYDLAFVLRDKQNAKRIGRRLSVYFGRKSRRIASFWMMSLSKIEEP